MSESGGAETYDEANTQQIVGEKTNGLHDSGIIIL